MKKKYKIFTIFAGLIIFFTIGVYFIKQDVDNEWARKIKDNIPFVVKKYLKKTIFYIPSELRDYKKLKNKYERVENRYKKTILNYYKYRNKFEEGTFKQRLVSGKNNTYSIDEYILPFYVDESLADNNPKGYLELIKNHILVIFGSGKSIIINKDELIKNNFQYTELKNNIFLQDLFNSEIKWSGIKDIKIDLDKIYISLTKEISKSCYNTALFVSDVNINFLNFKDLKISNECLNSDQTYKSHPLFEAFKGYQTGGRIQTNKDSIFLTIGDYNRWDKPQDDNSIFGKIFMINKNTNNVAIISKGHRNQQGLYLINEDLIITTEHGPKGGDEINLLKLNEKKIINYGWPMSSYGDHYDSVPKSRNINKIAPVKKNHKKYGYQEPVYYFKDSIGISEITKNNFSDGNSYFVTSLKNKKIYDVVFDKNFKNPIIRETIDIGARIRDIIYDQNLNVYYIYTEGVSPKLNILKKIN